QIGLLMEKILLSKNEHHIQFMNNLILGNVFYPTLDVLIQHFKDIFIYEKPEAIDAIPFEYHLTFSVSNNDSFAVEESSTNENSTFSFTAHDVAPADSHPTVTSTSDAEVDETETMAQDISDAEADETETMAQNLSDTEADETESMAQDASDDEAESMVQDVLNAGVDDAESMTQDVSDAEVDETETMTQDVSDDEADDAKSMTQDVSNAEADEIESMAQDVSDAEADETESMAQEVSDAEVDEIESMAQDVSDDETNEDESVVSDSEADDTEMVFANTMESFLAPSTHYTDKATAVLDGSTAADLPDFCDLTPSEDPFETSVKPSVEPFVEPASAPQKKRQSTARKNNSEMSKSWQAIIFPIAMTLIFIAVVAFGIKSFFFKPEIFEASYRIETLSDDRVAFINTSACSKPIESCEWSVYYDDQLIQSFITDNLYPIFDTVGEYTISLRIMDADGNWSNTYSEVYPYGQSQ
ncbi:MAG: hypothetical protein PWP51_951, partial [Clostridiales bacterium]|nr:hypothetical protein [Clostridiales bacterium]